MAGERKGVAYEAIVKLALDQLVTKGLLKGKIFWNEKPVGMTIEPDFTVGADKNKPSHVFLVTHSGASGNSHMKFWRNLGELAEAKTRLPVFPRVYSIVFDPVIKPDLKALQGTAFDGQLVVGETEYGRALRAWVDNNAAELPKDKEQKAARISELIAGGTSGRALRSLIAELARELGVMTKGSRKELDALWTDERKRTPGRVPGARETFVRRGLAKLLVIPDDVRKEIVAGKRIFVETADLKPALILGILAKHVSLRGQPSRLHVSDPEVLSALSLLSQSDLDSILCKGVTQGVRAVVDQVRSVARLGVMLDAVVRFYEKLVKPGEMLEALEKQHANPSHLLSSGLGKDPFSDVWLFRIVLDLVKAIGGAKQGYGYAQLVQDIKKDSECSGLSEFVRAVTGQGEWSLPKSTEPVRRGLQDYVNRIPGTSFSRSLLAVVAYVLSSRLARLPKDKIVAAMPVLLETWVSSAFKARLLAHRGFDPVGVLVKRALAGLGAKEVYLSGCFGQAAGGLKTVLAGTTKVTIVKGTLVNWQSVSSAGRDHKKKELCARAVALRYEWDSQTRRFISRKGVKKLILVVDGTWRQEELQTLASAGWDEIYYPDEMDRLIKAIV